MTLAEELELMTVLAGVTDQDKLELRSSDELADVENGSTPLG